MNQESLPRGGRKVTIRTVAEDAGVSVAAVSKVLRDAYGVSDALRQKVNASIERLGYRPSVAARGMRGQTFTLGILLVEIANPFVAEIVDGVNRVLLPSRYQALMGMGQARQPLEASLIEAMIDSRMDGLILVAPMIEREVLARYAARIPIVAVGHHDPESVLYDTVNSDDEAGAMLAVRALLERGHREIAFVSPPMAQHPRSSVIRWREAGFRRAIAEAGPGVTARFVELPARSPAADSEPARQAAMTALLTAPDRPRAMFCWSDLDAVPLVNAAQGLGLRLPQDLAIVGYDNSWVAGLPLIGLASIAQDGHQLGERAARAVLSRIGGRSTAEHLLIAPRLMARASL